MGLKRTNNAPNLSDIYAHLKQLKKTKSLKLGADNGFTKSPFLDELKGFVVEEEETVLSPNIVLLEEDKEKLKQFKLETKACLKAGGVFPLLILNGGEGFGKSAIAKSLGFDLGLKASKFIGEGMLQLITSIAHEDERRCQILITNGFRKATITRPFYEIIFNEEYYKPLFEELLRCFCHRYGFEDYSFDNELSLSIKDFLERRLLITPAVFEGVFQRAKKRAGIRGEELSDFHLKESINSFKKVMERFGEDKEELPSLNDIVLSKKQRGIVDEVLKALERESEFEFLSKYKSNKAVILFSGPSGTGKTMTARAIAKESGSELHVISPSDVLGRYVGDNEKNLASVFERAKKEDAILLFDEVDSFITGRYEGERSWERSLTNTFLNLLDDHDGTVIFTTNFSKELDSALNRRIDYKLKFPAPTKEMQVQILVKLLEPDAPLADSFDYSKVLEGVSASGGMLKVAVKRLSSNLDKPITTEVMREKILEVLGESDQLQVKRKIGI